MVKNETERFQVPVNGELAAAIAELAESVDRSSAWLAAELLDAAVEDHERFSQWITLAFIGDAYAVIKKLAKARPKVERERPEVRLQLNVKASTVRRIQKIADQFGQTPVKTAAMLLASAVHHHEIFISFASVVKKVHDRVVKGSPSSQASQRDERNTKLIMSL